MIAMSVRYKNTRRHWNLAKLYRIDDDLEPLALDYKTVVPSNPIGAQQSCPPRLTLASE